MIFCVYVLLMFNIDELFQYIAVQCFSFSFMKCNVGLYVHNVMCVCAMSDLSCIDWRWVKFKEALLIKKLYTLK